MAFSYFNGLDPSSVYFLAAEQSERIILHTATFGTVIGIPVAGGLLLICAGVAIITSSGHSFLLAPSNNLTRDIYQRFINPVASEKRVVLIQRTMVLILGFAAYLLLTQFTTILDMAFTAYTMVGAGLTPALLAAFLWKRVTTAGGVAHCYSGMGVNLIIIIDNLMLVDKLFHLYYIIFRVA